LLDRDTVAVRDRGAQTCIAREHADNAGFAIWTINIADAGGVRESALAVHGRWRTDGSVSRVEAMCIPRPWFGVLIMGVLGIVGLLWIVPVVDLAAFQGNLGNVAPPMLVGGMPGTVVLAIVSVTEFRELAWDPVLRESLRGIADSKPGAAGARGTPWRIRRRRR